jgi:membrane protein DedA with SNARE-associated domain
LKRREYWLGILAMILTVGVALGVVFYWEFFQSLGAYGYLGAFLIGILGGATYIAPIPMTPVIFALGAVLKPSFAPYLGPLFIGLAAGVGETVGGLTVYLTGYGGGQALVQLSGRIQVLYMRVLRWMERRGSWVIFILSATLNPFFYPAAIAAGAMRYNLKRFILLSVVGKTIKGILVAAAGYWGLGAILRALGIPL